jgi:hypothetical protein
MLKHCFYLVIYVLGCEAELFVEHLVRSRETEAFESEYLSVAAYKALEVDWKTCCETEDLGTVWKDALLVLDRLVAEESLRRTAYDSCLDAVLVEKGCTGNESRYL